MLHTVYIVPSIEEFADAFSGRLTPPYDIRDAASDMQRLVLDNVRAAYRNNDQIPIPAGTSAEAGVANVIRNTSREVALVSRLTRDPFAGSADLRERSSELSGKQHSPFKLIEAENDWYVGVYEFKSEEVANVFSEDILHQIGEHGFELSNLVLITASEELTDEEEEMSWLFQNMAME